MMEWIVKKVIVSKVNDLLKKHEGNVSEVRVTLEKWIGRIGKILACLQSTLKKLEDNQIDADELEQTRKEITDIVSQW